MRKLPLIFLPLLLIALSACSRSPSPPMAEPPVLAAQPTEQTTIPPEQINEPGQESSSQPVTEPMPEPTAPSVTEPASAAAAADTPPNTEPASQPRSLRSRLRQSHRQHPHGRSQQQNRPLRRRRRSRQKPHSTSTTGSAMRRPSPRKRGWFWNHRPWTAGTTPSPQIQTAFTWSEASPPD